MCRNSILTSTWDNLLVDGVYLTSLTRKTELRGCRETQEREEKTVRGDLDPKPRRKERSSSSSSAVNKSTDTDKETSPSVPKLFSPTLSLHFKKKQLSFRLTLTITGDERAAVSTVLLKFALFRGCLAGGPLHEEVVFAVSALPSCSGIQ